MVYTTTNTLFDGENSWNVKIGKNCNTTFKIEDKKSKYADKLNNFWHKYCKGM